MNPVNIPAEKLLRAHKSHLSTWVELVQKSFDSLEQLVELNMRVTRASLSEAADQARMFLSAPAAKDLQPLHATLQSSAEKMGFYIHQVYGIARTAETECSRIVEAKMVDAQQELFAAVDDLAKIAPSGNENLFALMKSVMSAAHETVEGVQKASRQATDVVQENIQVIAATPLRQRVA